MTDAARKTADRILSQAGQAATGREPRIPPIDELAELARAYLATAGTDQRERLGGSGEVLYVTLGAAREYGAYSHVPNDEAARQQLTALLIDARQDATDLSLWRARSKSTDLDIAAHVAIEGRLLVVTTVRVRSYNTGAGRRDR